jgi:hypothetical protein
MFPIIFAAILISIVVFDYIFMHRSNRRVWKFIAGAFGLAAALALFPGVLDRVAETLHVGRPVDIIVYLCCAILFRELFLSRARDYKMNEQLTTLVRELAIKSAESVAAPQGTKSK